MTLETDPQSPIEYFPGNAVTLSRGESARTSFLVGCLVPVILYPTTVVMGHFGPGRIIETHDQLLARCLGRKIPFQATVYHLDLSSSNFWERRVKEYEDHFRQMKEIIVDVTSISMENILEKAYPHYSKILIDWTAGGKPNIEIQPAGREIC